MTQNSDVASQETTPPTPRADSRLKQRLHRPRVRHPEPTAPRHVPWSRADTISMVTVGIVALITRFVGITMAAPSGTPVFDEKHYVPQAFDMLASWINPILGGIELNPGYGLVVHPPLGKQLLALGEAFFGYSPMGWRLMTALVGTATIVVIMNLARRLSGSWRVATCAGIISLCDGVLLIASRFGMLDIFQTFFIVVAAWALAADRHQVHQRLHAAFKQGLLKDQRYASGYGPRLGFRWWRFGAGVALGCALSVKWSGLYYMAFFGILSVAMDMALRRRYGVRWWFSGTILRDAVSAFCSIVILPAALYVWSWRAWFASETSVYRHALEDGTLDTHPWLAKLPESLAGFFYYHQSVLEFHSSLTTSTGHIHPWESKPWAWLVSARPVLYYSHTDMTCFGGQECRSMIYLFGTPIIWWLTVPVLLWGIWSLIIRRETQFLILLVSFAAGFLPWVAAYDRQMYFFYAVPLAPFTILLLSLTLGQLFNKGPVFSFGARRTTTAVTSRAVTGVNLSAGTLAAIAYLALVILAFLYWLPILYGIPIPDSYYNSLMWLRSWV